MLSTNKKGLLKHSSNFLHVPHHTMLPIFSRNFIKAENINSSKSSLQSLQCNAEMGDINSMVDYGKKLIHKDEKTACNYFKKAADRGNLEAASLYASLIKKEYIKIQKNHSSSFSKIEESNLKNELLKYLKISADSGNSVSQMEYADFLIENPSQYYQALSYYKKSANQKNIEAADKLILFDFFSPQSNEIPKCNGISRRSQLLLLLSENYNEQSFNELKKIGDDGDIYATLSTTMIIAKAKPETAQEIIQSLENVKFEPANSLKKLISSFIYSTLGKEHESFKLMKEAADSGFIIAKYFISFFYLNAPFEKKDQELALEAIKFAYENGMENARLVYAKFLHDGIGCHPDPKKVIEILKNVKRNENERYIYNSSLMKLQKYEELLVSLKEGMEEKDSNCFYLYGMMKMNGIGVPLDKESGVEMLQKAATMGNEQAMSEIAATQFDDKVKCT
ncbi:hypothetical protein TRFO_08256 [Tritrichomonas foetus]|uniref:Sel1 repeat family protein n=1 Tax=Tritrichomonas foetus TaxID=1144522 RepID=A0A1J4JKL3_9EUKA|nr:hypothetical protein TRFO_08256 [Tritrichomonas foetus]|eukprot:OHS99642.1 hypothetical protein TRFO_08256 [Tritrichomonas foetus]